MSIADFCFICVLQIEIRNVLWQTEFMVNVEVHSIRKFQADKFLSLTLFLSLSLYLFISLGVSIFLFVITNIDGGKRKQIS